MVLRCNFEICSFVKTRWLLQFSQLANPTSPAGFSSISPYPAAFRSAGFLSSMFFNLKKCRMDCRIQRRNGYICSFFVSTAPALCRIFAHRYEFSSFSPDHRIVVANV